MKLIKKVSQTIAVIGKILGVKTESDVDTYSCNYINDLTTTEKTTSTEKSYSCDYINSLTPIKYIKTTKGQIGGETTKDIKLSDIEGNETILIFISGIHYDGSDNYSHATYLLRKYGTYNALKQMDKKQAGAINLSLTYVPTENKITINNTGAYGCQYSITFI